jgi:hypothetical protein
MFLGERYKKNGPDLVGAIPHGSDITYLSTRSFAADVKVQKYFQFLGFILKCKFTSS